jgi:hypothetical protein
MKKEKKGAVLYIVGLVFILIFALGLMACRRRHFCPPPPPPWPFHCR